jgi:hypothetical protein
MAPRVRAERRDGHNWLEPDPPGRADPHQLNYVMTNAVAADDLSGTFALNTGTAPSGIIVVPPQVLLPVVAATGYTITLSGTSTGAGPLVTCTGLGRRDALRADHGRGQPGQQHRLHLPDDQ